jgi:NADH-quinone oxidoreductase subunit H
MDLFTPLWLLGFLLLGAVLAYRRSALSTITIAFTLALIAWAVMPVASGWVISNLNVGVLYLFAVSSLGVYGIVMAGWASNSRYAFLGAMRSAAQMVSYEVSIGFVMICVLMTAGSLNLSKVVEAQTHLWYFIPHFPMFIVFFISVLAETNRHPFDLPEAESELVAGFMTEYSSMAFALFFLAEYANMILVSALTSLLFLGGWLSPVGFLPDGIFWLFVKMSAILFLFLWFRATFPRYRYDQLMRLGWKVFLPICLIWLVVVGVWMMSPLNIWK